MNLILVKLAITMVMDSFLIVEGSEIHCLAVARTGMTLPSRIDFFQGILFMASMHFHSMCTNHVHSATVLKLFTSVYMHGIPTVDFSVHSEIPGMCVK